MKRRLAAPREQPFDIMHEKRGMDKGRNLNCESWGKKENLIVLFCL